MLKVATLPTRARYLEMLPAGFLWGLLPILYQADHYLKGITIQYVAFLISAVCLFFTVYRKKSWSINRIDLAFGIFLCYYAIRITGAHPFPGFQLSIPYLTLAYLYFWTKNQKNASFYYGILYISGLVQCFWFLRKKEAKQVAEETARIYQEIKKLEKPVENQQIISIFQAWIRRLHINE